MKSSATLPQYFMMIHVKCSLLQFISQDAVQTVECWSARYVCLRACLLACLHACLACLFVCMHACLLACMPACLPASQPVCLLACLLESMPDKFNLCLHSLAL